MHYRPGRRLVAVLLALAAFALPTRSQAQEGDRYRISGRVLQSSGGAPLFGAQVLVRGTRLGVLSVADGRYSINAAIPAGRYVLQYSFIGRATATREIVLGVQHDVTVEPVVLAESAVELEELVVTAPGATSERRALGNAVASVSGEAINRAPATSSIGVALQGKITGALISVGNGQPGAPVTIRLRGNNSILGTAEPLIVVDGVIIDNTTDALIGLSTNATRGGAGMSSRLSDISPDDVERIEVLKGASAAALYGSRAKNGVIQIFTKRGQDGSPRITWGSELEINGAPDLLELNMSPKASFADVAIAAGSGVTRPDGTPLQVGDQVTRIDAQDLFYRNSTGANTQVSVSGGTANTTYFMSGAYRNDQGILRNSGAQRYNVRGKLTQQIGERLELTGNGNFIKSHVDLLPEGEQGNGVLTSAVFTPTIFDPRFNESLGRYPYNPVLGTNPLNAIENFDAPEDVTRFVGNLDMTYRLRDNLRIRYLFGLDDYRQESRFFRPPFAESATFTGSVQNPIRLSTSKNHDLTGTLESRFSDRYRLTSLGGFRYTSQVTDIVRSGADVLSPGQTLVGGATQFASQSFNEVRTESFFVQEQAALSERLFLTAGANYEASSAFGADERWQLFPRAGVSFVALESGSDNTSSLSRVFSTLRLRAAYGETGGQPPSLYDRFANYINVGYAGRAGLTPSSIASNPSLKPERQREIETGFEAGFLRDRAVVEFTYYDQKTTDLVLNVPLAASSGFTLQRQNVGEVVNKGVEVALNTINLTTDRFTWRSRVSVGSNKNKVTKLVATTDTIIVGYLNAVIEGQPVGVFYGGQYARTPEGEVLYGAFTNAAFPGQTLKLPLRRRVDNLNGNAVNTGTFVNGIIGDPNPAFTASFSNTMTVGSNFDLNILFDGRFGNDVANFTRRITEFFGSDKVLERESNGDTIPLTYGRSPSGRINIYEEYIEDGSFIKLREISATYRINQPWVRHLGAKSMNITVAGRNLHTWTDYTGMDPELNLFSANTVAQGVDFANTPLARSFVFGVNFTF
ncbi:MAG: SusC/RagA family TonB-linked outer membrane protein [Longimicrobiales bacterium]